MRRPKKTTDPSGSLRRGHCVLAFSLILCAAVVARSTSVAAQTPPADAPAPDVQRLLDGSAPETVADLKAIERHTRRVSQQAVSCTVAIRRESAVGSGVIVSSSGYVLTAAHVAGAPGSGVAIILADGRTLGGKTIASRREMDVGIIRITREPGTEPAEKWPHAPLGHSSSLRDGQWCIATGHPGGYRQGRKPIVRIGRVLKHFKSTITTDCTLVGGDSGGPLFDLSGRIIGIHSRIGGSLTVNVHVPIDVFRQVLKELLQKKDPPTRPPSDERPEAKNDGQTSAAPLEGRLAKGPSPAETHPMRRWLKWLEDLTKPGPNEKAHGSVQVAFRPVVARARRSTARILVGGKPVALATIVDSDGLLVTKASLLRGRAVCRLADGRELPVTVLGTDREHDLALLTVSAVGLTPVEWHTAATPPVGSLLAVPGSTDMPLGIGIVGASPHRVPPARGMLGVIVWPGELGPRVEEILPNSGAERAGILSGDVIALVNGRRIRTLPSLIKTVRPRLSGEDVRLLLLRQGRRLTMTVTLGHYATSPAGKRMDFQNRLGGPPSERRTGFPSVLSHDAPLRPADCGGPLVGLGGRAVGINIARAGRASSLAIPASVVRSVLRELKSAASDAPATRDLLPRPAGRILKRGGCVSDAPESRPSCEDPTDARTN